MFNKKVLSLAVASAAAGLAMSSQAAIDLDSTAPTVSVYAEETVAASTAGVYNVTANAGNLDVNAAIGVGIAPSDQVFIRFDYTGAQFDTALAVGDLTVGTVNTGTVAQGGATGDSFAIFSVTAPGGGFVQADTMTLGVADLDLTGSGSDITMRAFETLTLAIAETSPLNTASTANAVSLGAALSTTFTANDATAEVTTDFTAFSSGGVTAGAANVGQLAYGVVTTGTLNATTGVAVAALSELITDAASTATFGGDFSFGSWDLASDAACTTTVAGLTVDTTGLAEAEATVAAANGNYLCVNVDGTDIIPNADYTVANVYTDANATPAFPVADDGADLGSITRNGTTVEIAYLTTFTDYNQRIIIVNRNATAADYSLTFSTEAGTTATPLAAATGTLQPGENLVLRAVDVVSLTGGTRCAATFTAVAPANRIEVATTQVNLSDASTDTVVYQ